MVSLEQVRALEDRVEKAVAYIAALRSENAEMERRLSEYKALADGASAAAERKASEAERRALAAEEKLSEAEAAADEARAARDAALARIREFEARVTDMAERVAAAETRAAEISARADEYRKDQARIEEGIIHALEKLDSFEDLVLSRPAEGADAGGAAPVPAEAAGAEASRPEDSSGIAVKTPAAAPAEDSGRGAGELDIF